MAAETLGGAMRFLGGNDRPFSESSSAWLNLGLTGEAKDLGGLSAKSRRASRAQGKQH